MMKGRLDEFTNGFLQMTFNHQPQHLRAATSRIDVSFDQLFIASPTSKGFSRNTLAKKVAAEIGAEPLARGVGPVDAFAGWHVRGGNDSRTNFAWGWTANIAVRVDSIRPNESRFPELAVSATLSLPNVGVADEAVTLMSRALNSTGLSAGVADADNQYFPNARVERLHEPVYALGFTPSTDYRVEQLGVHGGKAGAEFIEGKAYCPSMPQPHRHARHAIESLNTRLNDPSRENIGDTSRRNVRGFAAAQVFVTMLLTNYNLRTIAAFIAKRISADNDKGQVGASDTIGRRNSEWPTPHSGSSSSRPGSTVEPDGNAPTP
jgi:hypothetical protein